MKFTISVSDFQYAMRTVRDVVPSSGPLAETVGVLIDVQGGRAVFTAYNPEVMAKAAVRIKADRDGEAVVDAASLYGAISHFKPLNDKGVGTGDITVTSAPKSKKLYITAKTTYASGAETPHKRVFPLRNHEFFPTVPAPDKVDRSFELSAGLLMEGIDSVSYALSTDKNQLIFTGALFQLKPGGLTLFATNGVCLAEYTAPVSYEGDPVSVILPGVFASKISRSFFDTDVLTVSLTPNMMFVRTQNLVLGGALIREEYPNYKEVLPSPERYALIDKHVLLDNLINLNYEASSTEDNRVTLSLRNGEASLRCGPSDNGGLKVEFDGEAEIDCNLGLFVSSIKNVCGDTLKVGLSGPSSPLRFSSVESSHSGAELTCVLVPLA